MAGKSWEIYTLATLSDKQEVHTPPWWRAHRV